jgi:signal transduction histidine kinase
MRHIYAGHRGEREGLLLLALAAVPAGTDLALASGPAAPVSSAALTSLLGAVFFTVASLFLYLDWRLHAAPGRAWLVAAMAVLSCQLLSASGLALDPSQVGRQPEAAPLVIDLVMTCVVLGMAAIGLREHAPRLGDPLLVGLAVGVLGAISKPALAPFSATLPVSPRSVIVPAVVLAYVALAVVVLRHPLPRWVTTHLALSITMLAGAYVLASTPGAVPHLAAGTLLLCSGAWWAGAAIALQRRSVEQEHERVVWAESSLLSHELEHRASREAMHALKSTIAGLTRASELLERPDLTPEARQHLEHTVTNELARMERLLSMSPVAETEVVNLDSTLDAVLDLHRVQGRTFAWTPSGNSVLGRQDDVAEAVNILLDNAVKHGDASSGRVDVSVDEEEDMVRIAVSDGGPGVPAEMRQRIFEWGERGASSHGQGIGLSMARRLVSEQGGSLTLSEAGTGSSFVISLPTARRSMEDLHDRSQHASR